MISYRKMVCFINNGRHFHTINSSLNSKTARVMGKLMGMRNKKKFYVSKETPILPSIGLFGKVPVEHKITGNPRRSSILNKLFMRNLTDLMATGEYSTELVGYGLEVNKVKISSDYKFLKVYWIAKESSDDDQIENTLKKIAGSLRHELSQLRLMGQVPNIIFVKDKSYYKILEVEKKLAIADFGEDHVSPDLADQLRTESELWTILDADLKKDIEAIDSAASANHLVNDIVPPPMPHNVLGLDHAGILDRIKKKKRVTDIVHTKESSDQDNAICQNIMDDFVTKQEQREAFRKFLHSRQIFKSKLKKGDKNWTPDRQYLLDEMIENQKKSLELDDDEPYEEDYIEDIDEDNKQH